MVGPRRLWKPLRLENLRGRRGFLGREAATCSPGCRGLGPRAKVGGTDQLPRRPWIPPSGSGGHLESRRRRPGNPAARYYPRSDREGGWADPMDGRKRDKIIQEFKVRSVKSCWLQSSCGVLWIVNLNLNSLDIQWRIMFWKPSGWCFHPEYYSVSMAFK